MRATVSAADFAEAVARVGKGSQAPIRLDVGEALAITGGDEFGDIILSAAINATETASGAVNVPAVLVGAAAQMRTGTVTLSLDGSELKLAGGRKTSLLPTLTAERHVAEVGADFSADISADAKSFSAAMRATAKWTADPVYGGALAGVRVASDADGLLSLVATNRYAIRQEQIAGSGKSFEALIPGPVAAAWPSAPGEIRLTAKGGRLLYTIPDAHLVGQIALLAQDYPKLDHLLNPDGFAAEMTIHTAALNEAIASVFAQNHGAFDLHLTSTGVRLDSAETGGSSDGVGRMSAYLADGDIISTCGAPFVARVNRKFAGVLNVGSEIRIAYLGPKRPLYGFSGNVRVALMPLVRA